MSPLNAFAVVAAALIFAFAFERLWNRVGQIPSLVRAATREARGQGAAGLQEAVAAHLGPALKPIAVHEERLIQTLRAELTAAELRARIADVQAQDTRAALLAAQSLLRELRKLLKDAQMVRGIAESGPADRATVPAPPAVPALPASSLPSTVPPPGRAKAPGAASEEAGDSEDEMTHVGPWSSALRLPSIQPDASGALPASVALARAARLTPSPDAGEDR
jgi:hypothetical protein